MSKDSQIDPKPISKQKANGGPTMAESALIANNSLFSSYLLIPIQYTL